MDSINESIPCAEYESWPTRWRKKPVVIQAVRYDGSNETTILDWISYFGGDATADHDGDPGKGWHLEIRTLEGVMRADIGDWIIRGVRGEFYPCKPDIFEATYEPEQFDGQETP